MERIKHIDKITLKDMINNISLYSALSDGLVQLPLPESIQIGKRKYTIPFDVDEFTISITYGQRLFLTRSEDNDFGTILRVMDGYYYPIVTGEKWNEKKSLLFGRIVITCIAKDLYPTAMHLVILVSQMAEREQKLLHREPSSIEMAAGISKLNVFSELSAIDFLCQSMRKTEEEVMLTPYNDCLARFMLAKETAMYQERYMNELKAKK
jgi:hypothetical protein